MTQSAAGTTFGISSSAPATYNVAGFSALTYTNIGEVTSGGEFGKTFQMVTSQILSRRAETKRKGTFNAGQLPITVELNNSDAGQTALQAALDSDSDYSIVVTLQNGDKYYLRGLVTKFAPNIQGPNTMVTASCTIELQGFENAAGDEVAAIFDAA